MSKLLETGKLDTGKHFARLPGRVSKLDYTAQPGVTSERAMCGCHADK